MEHPSVALYHLGVANATARLVLELKMSVPIARISLELNGTFYAGFRNKLRDGVPVYGPEEQSVIQSTVYELLGSDTTSKPGMLLGKIQSGKTKTFLGIVALAFDNGFDIAVVLTKPTTALAKQTYKRVSKEFAEFIECDDVKVYDILEIPSRLTQFELNQKLSLRGQEADRQSHSHVRSAFQNVSCAFSETRPHH